MFSIQATQEKDLKESITKVTAQEQKTTEAANTFRQTKKFKDAVHYGKHFIIQHHEIQTETRPNIPEIISNMFLR